MRQFLYGTAVIQQETGGYRQTKALLELNPRPTALFTTNNLTTTGALMALQEAGVQIPEEMALVGFDDTPWARIVHPALTVVEQPAYLLGTTAAQLLFARLNGRETSPLGRIVQLKANLVIRQSYGAGLKREKKEQRFRQVPASPRRPGASPDSWTRGSSRSRGRCGSC